MTLISLSDCCRLLTIDPKTLPRWLDLAHVPFLAHPTDARIKGITASRLCQIATAHHRILADFPEAAPLPVQVLQLQEPPRSLRAPSSSAKRLRAPVHVLPLVEYGTHGGYVIICPEHGLLTFQPDSTEWFAWLATRSSFRFVGQSGRFTAHREFTRVPGCAWRAHRQIRNHTYNIRLGSTESLTIAALEQAAAELQSHLA